MGKHSVASAGRHGRRRRLLVLVGGMAVCASAAIFGVAVASPNASTTDVTFIRLTPAHKVLSSASVASLGSKNVVVIGGSTTVPTNTTTVQVTISVKGAKAGDLDVWPTGNENGGTNVHLGYPGGNQIVTATFGQKVGMSNEITFGNTSPSAMTVTATVIGYSTQVTAGDVSASGGSAGQVLTNTGSSAVWAAPAMPQAYAEKEEHGFFFPTGPATIADVDTLTVPAGTYAVEATASYDLTNTALSCWLVSPGGNVSVRAEAYSSEVQVGSLATQALIQTTGGDITLRCGDGQNLTQAFIDNDTIIATQVGGATGVVLPATRNTK